MAICVFVIYRSGYAIISRLHVDVQEWKLVSGNRPCILKVRVK